jgi:hypothetical protein
MNARATIRDGVKTRVLGGFISCPFVVECMASTLGRGSSAVVVAKPD